MVVKKLVEKNWVIEIRWPADIQALGLIRDTLGIMLRDLQIESCDIDKIEISIDEACTNVIEHAYKLTADSPDACPSHIQMTIRIFKDRIHIDIVDKGVGAVLGPHKGFENVEEYHHYTFPGEERPRGLGIHIIRKCMDEVDLSYPDDSGTCLSMVKYLTQSRENGS